jgi:hypothetical protein
MRPICIGIATWYFAGATSAGGIAALVLKRSTGHNGDRHTGEVGDAESRRDLNEHSSVSQPNAPALLELEQHTEY